MKKGKEKYDRRLLAGNVNFLVCGFFCCLNSGTMNKSMFGECKSNEKIRSVVFAESAGSVFDKQILSVFRRRAAAAGVQIYLYLSADMGLSLIHI